MILSWPPIASNLFSAVLKFSPVIFFISSAISLSNPSIVLIPVPTAVPPAANSRQLSKAFFRRSIPWPIAETYPENSCPKLSGVASCRCVLPTLIISLNFLDLLSNDSLSSSNDGIRLCVTLSTAAIFIAVGKVSFVDWLMFT